MPRKKNTADIADALGTGEEPLGPFTESDVIAHDPDMLLKHSEKVALDEMSRPEEDPGSATVQFADVDASAELERVLSLEAPEEHLSRYDKLSPKAKELFLAAYEPDPLKHILQNNPRFVDKTKVPKNVVLHWVSRNVAKELGWRGWTPVPNRADTREWLPNMKLHRAQRFIMQGRVVLCFKSKWEWLQGVLRDLKETNAPREEFLRRFAPALRTRHSELGLTKEQALALEAELGGLIATRGPGPGDKPSRGLTTAVLQP